MTPQPIIVIGDQTVLGPETDRFLYWLTTSMFDRPAFEWRALSAHFRGGGPGVGYGFGGFFYDNDGRWQPARSSKLSAQDEAMQDEFVGAWIKTTTVKLGKVWQAALVQVVKHPNRAEASIAFEIFDMERWRRANGLLGDMLRPNGLPIPPGAGLL